MIPKENRWNTIKLRLQSRRGVLFFLLFGALLILPLWVIHYPPMVDLPQHAAQINALLKYNDPATHYSDIYQLNWFTPYLLGYSMVLLFTPLFSVLGSLKVVISGALLALPFAANALIRENDGNPEWTWILFPTAMGYAFYWGFLNFIVAIPFVILLLVFTIRFIKSPSLKKALGLAVFVHFMFLAHALLTVFSVSLCCLVVLIQNRSLRKGMLQLLPYLSVIPTVLIWFHLTTTRESQVVDKLVIKEYGLHRFLEFFSRTVGMPPTLAYVILGLSLFVIPFILGARPSHNWRSWIPLFICALVFMILPLHIFGTGWLYPRFAIFLLPFFLMALKKRPVKRLAFRRSICVVYIVFCLVLPLPRFLAFHNESEGYRDISKYFEDNKRVLSLIFERNSAYAPTPVYMHFPSWYQLDHNGVVDFNFALFYPEIIRYRTNQIPRVGFGFEWNPGSFDWHKHKGNLYDYFVVHSGYNLGPVLFKHADIPIQQVAQSGRWWLYKSIKTGIANTNENGRIPSGRKREKF